MKKSILILITTAFFISCTSAYDSIPPDFTGKYVHKIPDCFSNNPEELCIEIIWIKENLTASLMFGGIDYGTPATYEIKKDLILFYYNNGDKPDVIFRAESDKKLIRLDDESVWIKE